jgi:hypothetical protein
MMNRLNLVYVWILLALVVLFGISGVMAQTLGNPTFNSITLASPLPSASVAFTPPGQLPVTLQARGLAQVFANTDYGASGSSQTITGSISVGSTALTLSPALDFVNGEGVLVPGAGATFTAGALSVTASVVGTAGSTNYCYDVASADAAGGLGIPASTCVSNGNVTLSAANQVSISVTPGSGASAYVIWKQTSAGAWSYLGSGQASTYIDSGFAGVVRPRWVPATVPSSAQNDWLVASISAGGGTANLTLATAAKNTVSSVTVRHDDTAALNMSISTATPGTLIWLPCGAYNTSGPIGFSNSNDRLVGYGVCTLI